MSRTEDRRRFVPKYPNSKWATVADVPTGARVIDGGVLKQKLQYFNNSGTDWVNIGMPTFLSSVVLGTDPMTVRFKFKPSASALVMFDFGRTSKTLIEAKPNTNVKVFFNNVATTFFGTTVPLDYVDLIIKIANDGKAYCFLNGVKSSSIASVANSPQTLNASLFGWISGEANFGYEGAGYSAKFYSGVGDINSASVSGLTMLDCYDFTKSALWNGGAAGVSEQGNAFTVTDGIPTPARQFDLIPVSMKC